MYRMELNNVNFCGNVSSKSLQIPRVIADSQKIQFTWGSDHMMIMNQTFYWINWSNQSKHKFKGEKKEVQLIGWFEWLIQQNESNDELEIHTALILFKP